jgi:hypothetical protein
LTRSGTALEAAGRLPVDLAFGIQRQLQTDRGALAQGGLGALSGAAQANRFIEPTFIRPSQTTDPGRAGTEFQFLGGLPGGDVASQLATLFGNQGQNVAQGALSRIGAQQAHTGQILGLAGNVAKGFAASSDPRLKTNVVKVSTFRDLNVYQWDWVPEATNTVKKMPTVGFMATEVEVLYPHHVGEVDGFQIINYPPLLDELDRKFSEAA